MEYLRRGLENFRNFRAATSEANRQRELRGHRQTLEAYRESFFELSGTNGSIPTTMRLHIELFTINRGAELFSLFKRSKLFKDIPFDAIEISVGYILLPDGRIYNTSAHEVQDNPELLAHLKSRTLLKLNEIS